MATEAIKSTLVTNADATPPTPSSPYLGGGFVKEQVGVAAIASGVTAGSTYRLGRIRSSDRVSQLLLSCTAVSTTGAVDIGLYATAADGGAVVDADLFASAQLVTSALGNSDITKESASVSTVANMEKRVWELLALTADPYLDYDVVATSTATMGGAGTIALITRTVE